MQWHPLFAKMLRPLVEEHYEVQTNLAVGDAPRAADIVLVRRLSEQTPPFRGLLHHFTPWNVLEFKGRSVSARLRDLPLLGELGLGIAWRVNEEGAHQRSRLVAAEDVSFWYLANHLGRRFLHGARQLLGNLDLASPGVWRSQILRHPLFLVDSVSVPVDRESVALHLAGEEVPEIEEALAHVLVEEPGYWELYGSLLGALHPNIFEEANRMATAKRKSRGLDLRPFIKQVGLDKFFEVIEMEDMIHAVGAKNVVKAIGVDRIAANLSAEERRKLKDLLS